MWLPGIPQMDVGVNPAWGEQTASAVNLPRGRTVSGVVDARSRTQVQVTIDDMNVPNHI